MNGSVSAPLPPSQVAILAGGQGTRLQMRTGNLPKPMVSVAGKPVLQHLVEQCRDHGFEEIALLVHHRHEVISAHFGDGSAFGVRIRYEVELEPRGTAGALRDALHHMAERILVMYGDTYMDVDLTRLWAAHVANGADATLFLHPNDHPSDSDLVVVDGANAVRSIRSYPHPTGDSGRNLVNAALYVMECGGLSAFTPEQGRSDIAKDMFPAMLAAGKRLHGYVSPEYIKDMGTPQRLDKVERDIEFGLPERLSTRSPRAAVFLDRDGTLNSEVEHLRDPSQLRLIDGAAQAVRDLNRAGRLAVVTTNQPVVARGEVSLEQLDRIHARLDTLLGERGAYLDRIYHCPHHPQSGFAGEVIALKILCDCRKPMPGMIDAACRDLAIGRQESWMVGDTTSDIEAGRRGGVKTVLVRTGHAGRDDKHALRPDYTTPDLAAAVAWILEGHPAMCRRIAPLAANVLGARLILIGGAARSGKSSAAQVLKELLAPLGLTAHVLSLDSWLKPGVDRLEEFGVLARFDTEGAARAILAAACARVRTSLTVPIYDRLGRAMHVRPLTLSIGTADALIVEGVPALMIPSLLAAKNVVTMHLDAPSAVRRARIEQDYRWRGVTGEALDTLWSSREKDEVQVVNELRAIADHVIDFEAP